MDTNGVSNNKVLKDLIRELEQEVVAAEASLTVSEQVLVATRQRIVGIKLKIHALEELISDQK